MIHHTHTHPDLLFVSHTPRHCGTQRDSNTRMNGWMDGWMDGWMAAYIMARRTVFGMVCVGGFCNFPDSAFVAVRDPNAPHVCVCVRARNGQPACLSRQRALCVCLPAWGWSTPRIVCRRFDRRSAFLPACLSHACGCDECVRLQWTPWTAVCASARVASHSFIHIKAVSSRRMHSLHTYVIHVHGLPTDAKNRRPD